MKIFRKIEEVNASMAMEGIPSPRRKSADAYCP
jgi:hypothetical protein